MATHVVDRFIEALQGFEEGGSIELLLALYADTCTLGNVLMPLEQGGREGARVFWTIYLQSFRQIDSTFRNVIVGHGRAALEWQSEGESHRGKHVSYSGVTILEFDRDQITRTFAYFDTGHLNEQMGRKLRLLSAS